MTESVIEQLKAEDWSDMVQTIQHFSSKVEKKYPQDITKKAFKVNPDNLKLSINQLTNEWKELQLDETYPSPYTYEEDIYLSPYSDSQFDFDYGELVSNKVPKYYTKV